MTNQAKWYLNGPWPIGVGVKFHLDPEPKAMQELIDTDLAVRALDPLSQKSTYYLTEKGRKERDANRNNINPSRSS